MQSVEEHVLRGEVVHPHQGCAQRCEGTRLIQVASGGGCAELDEAVGAFVRAIQEAPAGLARAAPQPACGGGSGGAAGAVEGLAGFGGGLLGQGIGQGGAMTLQDGLDQLSRLKASLECL